MPSSPPSKNSLLHHHQWVRTAVTRLGAEALLSVESFQLMVRRGDQHWLLFPKFLANVAGARQYTNAMTDDAFMFAGWLPYRQRNWNAAADKLAFKEFASRMDLPVPEFAMEPPMRCDAAIVKRARSSFGAQIRGPYRLDGGPTAALAGGEYLEQFIEGRLLKVWYWNNAPLCAEFDRLPCVTGDGVTSIGELVMRRAQRLRRYDEQERARLLESTGALLAYYGTGLDAVLPKGHTQIVEFRYGSDLMLGSDRTLIDLTATDVHDLRARLNAYGERLQHALPADIRHDTLYTIDAILDREDRIWLLEMNSNPSVHPLLYPAILRDLIA